LLGRKEGWVRRIGRVGRMAKHERRLGKMDWPGKKDGWVGKKAG
jgi:hypothetical protein